MWLMEPFMDWTIGVMPTCSVALHFEGSAVEGIGVYRGYVFSMSMARSIDVMRPLALMDIELPAP